jgi:hypothetical protein
MSIIVWGQIGHAFMHTLFVQLLFRSTSHCPWSHDGTVVSCVAHVYWFTLALTHKLFVPLSALLSDLCPTVVLTLYDLGHCSSRARKDIVVTFTGPCARLESGLWQDHWPHCLFKKRAGLASWNHHSVHPSSLSSFPLSKFLAQAFLATTTHQGW